MPCRDGGPCCDYGAQHVDRVYKDKLDKVTRLLCELLTSNENVRLVVTDELREWWAAHVEEDRKRAEVASEAKRRDEQRRRDRIAELENELARLRGGYE